MSKYRLLFDDPQILVIEIDRQPLTLFEQHFDESINPESLDVTQ